MSNDPEYDDESNDPHPYDSDSTNVFVLSGYLRGMAHKLPPGEDRKFLLRASKSLCAYGELLRGQGQ
jgi:hypothetical protein